MISVYFEGNCGSRPSHTRPRNYPLRFQLLPNIRSVTIIGLGLGLGRALRKHIAYISGVSPTIIPNLSYSSVLARFFTEPAFILLLTRTRAGKDLLFASMNYFCAVRCPSLSISTAAILHGGAGSAFIRTYLLRRERRDGLILANKSRDS